MAAKAGKLRQAHFHERRVLPELAAPYQAGRAGAIEADRRHPGQLGEVRDAGIERNEEGSAGHEVPQLR